MAAPASDARANERLATVILAATAGPPALVVGLLCLLAGPVVAVVAFVVVAAAIAIAVWVSAEPRALAAIGGTPADPRDDARLFNLVEGLCAGAGVAVPRLVVVADAALNAVAVGRDPRRATLAVTRGLLDGLSRIELEGVLAEELIRIKRRDTLPGTLAAGAGPIGRRFAHPEAEETVDLAAVALTRYPPGLAAAFEKMAAGGTGLTRAVVAPLWLADPRSDAGAAPAGRLPLTERVAALREL